LATCQHKQPSGCCLAGRTLWSGQQCTTAATTAAAAAGAAADGSKPLKEHLQ
jgi:hypothetical protein